MPADLVLLVLRLAKAQAVTLQDGEDALDLVALAAEEGEEEDKDGRMFVKAAWDVYQLEKDPADFVDTVNRAVRIWVRQPCHNHCGPALASFQMYSCLFSYPASPLTPCFCLCSERSARGGVP